MSQVVDPKGSSGEDTLAQPNETAETAYRGYRDLDSPVGHRIEVTVDGDPIDHRYDLLSASPSGFEWGYGGSGPAQLPEEGWELTAEDIRRWHAEVTGDA